MITSRQITKEDYELLKESILKNSHHVGTEPEFFYDNRSITNIYEDEQGPVLFCRGTKALRIDLEFVNQRDRIRNAKVMIEGLERLAEQAKAAGFTEIVTCSDAPLMIKFCKEKLGFVGTGNELRKFI